MKSWSVESWGGGPGCSESPVFYGWEGTERSGKEKLQTVSKTGSESKRKGMEKLRQSEIKSVPVVA